jgi:WD40 repeat protein
MIIRSTLTIRVTGAMLCVWCCIGLCLSTGYAAELTSVALSNDQNTLILGDRIGNISAWSFHNGKRLWFVRGRGQPILGISFLSLDKWVIAVDGPDSISMIYNGKDKLTSFLDYRVTLEEQPSTTAAAAFKEDGGALVVAGSHFAEIFLLDVFTFVEKNFQKEIIMKDFETRSLGPSWQGLLLSHRTEPSTSRAVLGQLRYGELQDRWNDLAWCSKGERVVGVSKKGYLVAWDIVKKQGAPGQWDVTFIRQVGSNKDPERSLNGVACSESGKIATAGVPGRFGALQVWNSEGELECFAQPPEGVGPSDTIERVAFDRQAQYILSSGQSGYTLWRLTDDALVMSATIRADDGHRQWQNGRPIVGLDDGRFLLLSDEGAWLLDCKSRALTRSFGPRPSRLKVTLK